MKKKISKTKIEKRMRKKTNADLAEAIINLKKTNPSAAKKLSMPVRKYDNINIGALDSQKGDLFVAGKVLSLGEVNGKKKIVAVGFSEKAREKIKKAGGEAVLIFDEIKKNPNLKGLGIFKE
jgi:ribosomal protein L18E